jgi:hypothetical protein
MRTINVGNDYAFREQLKAEAAKVEKEVKQNDNNPIAGTEATGEAEQESQANTQEAAQGEGQSNKKDKGKKSQK